jgi:hypothetical protein
VLMELSRTKWQIYFSHLTMLMMGGRGTERTDWTMHLIVKKISVVKKRISEKKRAHLKPM